MISQELLLDCKFLGIYDMEKEYARVWDVDDGNA